MTTFKDLNLPEALSRALVDMNYSAPTEIQSKAIPVGITNRDVVGLAQTGTGKTAAFSIPIICNLIKSRRKRALILAPTRELVLQIDEVLSQLAAHLPELKRAVVIGGASMNNQIRALRANPAIVIATPGRLIDHQRQGTVLLSAFEILVLDEADRMLDMGFAPQLNEILRHMPKARQTMLFSATFPNEIEKMVSRYTKDPVRVSAGPVSKPIDLVSQSVLATTTQTKNDHLMDMLNEVDGSTLVFARTKRRTDKLAKYLAGCGYKVGRIHGDRSQKQRVDAIESFREGKLRVLVATDIAARGIDIANIAQVVNYDLPMVAEDYVHRIGRTGRNGATGRAVSLVTHEERPLWKAIVKLVGKSAPNFVTN